MSACKTLQEEWRILHAGADLLTFKCITEPPRGFKVPSAVLVVCTWYQVSISLTCVTAQQLWKVFQVILLASSNHATGTFNQCIDKKSGAALQSQIIRCKCHFERPISSGIARLHTFHFS